MIGANSALGGGTLSLPFFASQFFGVSFIRQMKVGVILGSCAFGILIDVFGVGELS